METVTESQVRDDTFDSREAEFKSKINTVSRATSYTGDLNAK